MIKRFATLTAGLVLAFGTLGSPAHATVSHHHHHHAPKLRSAIKACAVPAVSRRDLGACVSLYLRPATWSRDHRTYTPQGSALVAECLDQYRGEELHYCLTQPADS